MTLVLIIRSVEGIAIVTDSTTKVTGTRIIDNEEREVEYHIYHRRKMARIGKFAVVHAGMGFINGKTINQIIHQVQPDEITFEAVKQGLNEQFEKELEKDDEVENLDPGFLIVSLGITGFKENQPFLHRIIYSKSKEDEDALLERVESEDPLSKAEDKTPYGIDYFGDYEFIQLVIQAAKDRGLLKPFDILTIFDALELGRTLMRFLIDFQDFMVTFSVEYPIESAVITRERGFEWVDQLELREFHYDYHHD